MDVVQICHCSGSSMFTNDQDKVLIIEKERSCLTIGDKFGVGEKVNTEGTDKNLIRLVPVLGHGALVLLSPELVPVPCHGARDYFLWSYCPCLGTVPKLVFGHQQKDMFRLVSVPRHRAWHQV